MAIGKGLTAFLAAYYKSQEMAQKQRYYDLQLEYLRQKNQGGVPKGADAESAKGEKEYTPRFSGLKEGRSVGDPVSTDMAPHQRAFLNAVAAPESGGEYDRMYAGMGHDVLPTYFEGYDAHPDIAAPGPAGPSTAAGRYMFTKSTWDRLGGGSFDPANQDKQAWELARQDYAARTGGRDLDKELRTNGFTPQIASTLSPTWTGFKANPQLAASTYYSSLNRYNQPQVAEGALPVATTGTATPALAAAPLPPPRPNNLGQALPVEAGVTSPTPSAYAPEAYPQAIPVDYAAYDPYYTEAVYAAKGGLVPDLRQQWRRALPVQHFQAGGEVEDDDSYVGAGDPDPMAYQALYTGAGDAGGIPTQQAVARPVRPTQPAQPQFNNPISALLDTASDAVTAGVKWLHDKFDVAGASLSGVGEHAGLRGLANHEGAAPAADVQEAEDAVDPGKHLDAGGRRLAGMNAVYQYYLAHGESKKAKEVAGSMLMYSKRIAAEAADMALQQPNPVAAAKVLAQGNNQIPGARQFQVDDNGNYIIREPKTGKPINAGVVSPQQLLAAARGLKDGSVFWREISTYAKPDEDEKTAAEKKLEAAQGAADQFNKVYSPPGGAIPDAPPTVPATTAGGDETTEGRSASPTPVGAPGVPPPKSTAKAPTYGAYVGMSPILADTLQTKEQKDAWNALQRDNPGMAQHLQAQHEKRVLYYGSLAAQEAAKNAPAAPPKRDDAKVESNVNEAWNSHLEEVKDQKDPDTGEVLKPPPIAVQRAMKSIARGLVHANTGMAGDDAVDKVTDLVDFKPTGPIPLKDGKPDPKAAADVLPYVVGADKDGPMARFKDTGQVVRLTPDAAVQLRNLVGKKLEAYATKQAAAAPTVNPITAGLGRVGAGAAGAASDYASSVRQRAAEAEARFRQEAEQGGYATPPAPVAPAIVQPVPPQYIQDQARRRALMGQ